MVAAMSAQPVWAHIVSPVQVGPERDLYWAQPVTFASMRVARELAQREGLRVELLSAQYPEDEGLVPEGFVKTPALERSCAGLGVGLTRRLPLLAEILERLYQASTADYLVFTNVDIAVQPFFYLTLAAILRSGVEAFVVNRRTISDQYRDPRDLPFMYAELGVPHKGYDCFVFPRSLAPALDLGRVFLGAAGVGRTLLANLACRVPGFREFRDLHLTFHLGNSAPWRSPEQEAYSRANWGECQGVLDRLEADCGPFDAEFRSYLRDTGPQRFMPAVYCYGHIHK